MRVWNLSLVLVALAVAVFACQPLLADDKDVTTHEGKIVSAGDGKLTMTDKNGANRHTHNVPAAAKITCDGKECKLEDLKEGFWVKVTTRNDAQRTVTKIEAKKENK
jgi:hypothetical protein